MPDNKRGNANGNGGYNEEREFDFDYLLAVMEEQKRDADVRDRYDAERRELEDMGEDDGEFERTRKLVSRAHFEDNMVVDETEDDDGFDEEYGYGDDDADDGDYDLIYDDDDDDDALQFNNLEREYSDWRESLIDSMNGDAAARQELARQEEYRAIQDAIDGLRKAYETYEELVENAKAEREKKFETIYQETNDEFMERLTPRYEEYSRAYDALLVEVDKKRQEREKKKRLEKLARRRELERTLSPEFFDGYGYGW